jgi:hypothetical protein
MGCGAVALGSTPNDPLDVVIVGGGVAALEAALALRELGGKRVTTTMVAPNTEFVYRPMTVREPFGYAEAQRYPLGDIARDIGVELHADSFKSLDAERHIVRTEAGEQLSYDALLLALGARMHPHFEYAITIDDTRLDEQLHGLIQDIEGGYVHRLAFIVPGRTGWPLPIYELALMTAARAQDMNVELSITIATPEDAPLAIFGLGISEAVRQLLEENGILTITSAYCEVREPGRISVAPGSRELRVWCARSFVRGVHPDRRPLQGARARACLRGRRRDRLRDQAWRHRRAAGRRCRPGDRCPGGYRRRPRAVPSSDPWNPPDRRQAALPQSRSHRRPRIKLRDHRDADLVAVDQDRRQVPRAVPTGIRPPRKEQRMNAAIFNLNHPAHTVHWHFFQMSVANVVVIVLMLVVFAVAILAPFPRRDGHGGTT